MGLSLLPLLYSPLTLQVPVYFPTCLVVKVSCSRPLRGVNYLTKDQKGDPSNGTDATTEPPMTTYQEPTPTGFDEESSFTTSTTPPRTQTSDPFVETTTSLDGSSCPWFLCNNTRCVLDTWKCDLQDDCGDNSDEDGCGETKCNESEQFRCSSGMCISKDWICDWIKDCPHGDDEDNC